MKLGVYIGSFNPVHIGHIDVVNFLLNKNVLDKILIVPTLNYWDKNDLIDLKHRINMLKFFENEKVEVDTKNNGYSYTYELMRALSLENKNLYLIIGADNVVNFSKWRNYEELLSYKIIVMNRNNIDVNFYIKKFNSNNFIVLDYKGIDISSSDLRKNLDPNYLDCKVLSYIKKNRLYGE